MQPQLRPTERKVHYSGALSWVDARGMRTDIGAGFSACGISQRYRLSRNYIRSVDPAAITCRGCLKIMAAAARQPLQQLAAEAAKEIAKMPAKKITHVTVEFEDGSAHELRGLEACAAWQERAAAEASLASVYGAKRNPVSWDETTVKALVRATIERFVTFLESRDIAIGSLSFGEVRRMAQEDLAAVVDDFAQSRP